MKHILVSITYRGRLHWRLISARAVGKRWEISTAAYDQFLADIGYSNRNDGLATWPRRDQHIILG